MDSGQIRPLGDQAAFVSFDDEQQALNFAEAMRHSGFLWVIDIVQAYASVAVHFDLEQTTFADVQQALLHLSQMQREHEGMRGR